MNCSTVDEIQWVSDLVKGDIHAFNALYQQYQHAVYSNIFKFIQQADIAEDLLQEVFLTLWTSRHTLDARHPAGGWLFTVSHNKSVSYLRTALREKKMLSALALLPTEEDLTDETSFQATVDTLNEAIERLPAHKKKVFQLVKLEGKSYQEAADLLNTSPGFVKETLRSASKLIKAHLLTQLPAGQMAVFIFFLSHQIR